MRIKFLWLAIGVVTSTHSFCADVVNTDRYTLTKVDPRGDQRAPLSALATLSFGIDVKTVGDAIHETLNGSGYRWDTQRDDEALKTLPLPSVLRTLGPIKLSDALTTLAGQAWELKVDELKRTLWFEVRSKKISTY